MRQLFHFTTAFVCVGATWALSSLLNGCSAPTRSDDLGETTQPLVSVTWDGWQQIPVTLPVGKSLVLSPGSTGLRERVHVFLSATTTGSSPPSGGRVLHLSKAYGSSTWEQDASHLPFTLETDQAPTASALGQRIHVFIKNAGAGDFSNCNADQHVSSPDVPSNNLGKWGCFAHSVPGLSTDVAPSAASLRGRIYLFAREASTGLIWGNQAVLGQGFHGWEQIGGTTDRTPVGASLGASMYIVSKGVSNQATYINHHDDAATDSTNNTIGSFVGWDPIPGGGTTTQAHGVTSIGNTIYVFRRTSTGAVEWNSAHDGRAFAASWTALAGANAPTTNVAPSAAYIRDRIYVFVVGTNGALYFNSGKATPPIVGTWADAPAPAGFTFPYGVHSALLYNEATGPKVIMWSGGTQHNAPKEARVWDPTSLTWDSTAYTFTDDLFCSGLATLPDGSLLVAGGEEPMHPNYGLKTLYRFGGMVGGKWTWGWTKLAATMAQARWYPTLVERPDGRVMIFSGYRDFASGAATDCGSTHGVIADSIELFDPTKSAVSTVAGGSLPLQTYPSIHLNPRSTQANGAYIYSGTRWCANQYENDAFNVRVFDGTAWSAPGAALGDRTEGSAVLLPFQSTVGNPSAPDPQIAVFGGGQRGGPTYHARSSSLLSFGSASSVSVSAGLKLAYMRSNLNAVMLPDGTVLLVGGQQNYKRDRNPEAVRAAEVYNLTNGTSYGTGWMRFPRTYHSTAMLLPDGRVLAVGGEDQTSVATPNGENYNGEIFTPSYAQPGITRPGIQGASSTGFLGAKTYGAAFSVTVTNSGGTPTFRLVRPMAVTHHTDANQRQIVLTSTWNSVSSTATVNAPNAKEAPPGYYMLFAVSPSGIPSKAVWIKL